MSAKTCAVSLRDLEGTRHTVEVTAESLYEAAVIGLNKLRKDPWTNGMVNGTPLEINVHEPAVTHTLTVMQLERWLESGPNGPADIIKKNRLKALLAS